MENRRIVVIRLVGCINRGALSNREYEALLEALVGGEVDVLNHEYSSGSDWAVRVRNIDLTDDPSNERLNQEIESMLPEAGICNGTVWVLDVQTRLWTTEDIRFGDLVHPVQLLSDAKQGTKCTVSALIDVKGQMQPSRLLTSFYSYCQRMPLFAADSSNFAIMLPIYDPHVLAPVRADRYSTPDLSAYLDNLLEYLERYPKAQGFLRVHWRYPIPERADGHKYMDYKIENGKAELILPE